MSVTLDEVKTYLRVDHDDEDALIETLMGSASSLVSDISRDASPAEQTKLATLYAIAYLYEHREEADHHALAVTLRSLLSGVRKEVF